MTGPVFVDANVLVYWQDAESGSKQSRAEDWIAHLGHLRAARISFQILQGLYATLTRKVKPVCDAEAARAIVRDLAAWRPVAADVAIPERAWRIQERYILSWWNSLIVAAVHSCACSALLTKDLRHGQLLGQVRVIDPFASPGLAPQEVLASLQAW